MCNRLICTTIALWGAVLCTIAATFATARLQRLANELSLAGLDTLPVGTYTKWSHRGHAVKVRIDRYGEVCHIGYALFPNDIHNVSSLPVYDFLERHLLERLTFKPGSEDDFRMTFERVEFLTGDPHTVLRLRGDETFTEEHRDYRQYIVRWDDAQGKTVLSMQFDMDCQLLMGANAIELEHLFERRMARAISLRRPTPQPTTDAVGLSWTAPVDTFMAAVINNSMYYTRCTPDTLWSLVDAPSQHAKTMANLMLADGGIRDVPLNITLDKYGYNTSTINTTLNVWKQMCHDDGCMGYFGMRDKLDDGTYRGVVMMVNKTAGYVHMLSVSVPSSVLDGKEGRIEGRVIIYIPLHNVSSKFINL